MSMLLKLFGVNQSMYFDLVLQIQPFSLSDNLFNDS